MSEENRILNILKDLPASPSVNDDDYSQRYEARFDAFEEVVYAPDGLGFCGCGLPDSTLLAVQKILKTCALKSSEERRAALQDGFGVDYSSDDPLLQGMYYLLDRAGFIEHDFAISGSVITESGELFIPLLEEFVQNS